jgi:site-specific DNA-cytosine methylase
MYINIRICNHCKLVEVAWTPSDIIEINTDCLPALRYLHPRTTIRSASLLDIPFAHLLDTDGYIAGPPCPPTSTLGHGHADADPRAAVFDRCISTLQHFGERHGGSMLKFYILEHVTGSLKRRGLENESYASKKQHALRAALPHFVHHL